jgi:hypothetical protein
MCETILHRMDMVEGRYPIIGITVEEYRRLSQEVSDYWAGCGYTYSLCQCVSDPKIGTPVGRFEGCHLIIMEDR